MANSFVLDGLFRVCFAGGTSFDVLLTACVATIKGRDRVQWAKRKPRD